MEGKSSLCALAGEVQNHIVRYLDPVSIGALRCVNRHFNRTLSLDRSQYSTERNDYLYAIETSTWHPRRNDFACYDCDKMKPKSEFNRTQTRLRRGKNGTQCCLRRCMACLRGKSLITPGSVVKMNDGSGSQICCLVCSTMQRDWCQKCRLCRKCTERGTVRAWRKRDRADIIIPKCSMGKQENHWMMGANPESRDDNGWESVISGLLHGDVSRVAKSDFSPMQAMAMYDYYEEHGEMASPEWFDGPADI